jgi:uncharacterized membrane protein YgcG
MYLSYVDKKILIEADEGSVSILTDSVRQAVINDMTPYLSRRQYFQGIDIGIAFIDSVFNSKGEYAR